jgi:hypothetical protein
MVALLYNRASTKSCNLKNIQKQSGLELGRIEWQSWGIEWQSWGIEWASPELFRKKGVIGLENELKSIEIP